MNTHTTRIPADAELLGMLVRDLTERFPETLAVLAPLGIDLCCGGAHRLEDALAAHGLDREATLTALSQAVSGSATVR